MISRSEIFRRIRISNDVGQGDGGCWRGRGVKWGRGARVEGCRIRISNDVGQGMEGVGGVEGWRGGVGCRGRRMEKQNLK